MAKVKKKLSAAQKRAKKEAKAERQKKYEWVFMNGKQVRVKRSPKIDGMEVDEYIQRNADPIWLHQNEMWEFIETEENQINIEEDEDDLPF
jgi:calcineurin-like phosphoesterase family protein